MFSAYNKYTDDELLQMMKDNDSQSFAMIYRRYEEPLLSYAISVTNDREDAADILQEIFVSLWNRRTELQFNHSLKAWLYQAVRFQAVKCFHQNARKHDFLKEILNLIQGTDRHSPDAHLEQNELVATLKDTIEHMPARMKEVFVLSREEELSHREIGVKLNIAESTVKKQIQNALRYIREKSLIDLLP